MLTTRRHFIGSLAVLAAAGSLPRRAFAQSAASTYFEWKKLADGVFAGLGGGGNSLVVISGNEALLIDTKNAGFGATVRREAESLGAPLKLVINTHHHFDHTGGNPAFSKDLTLLAHAKAKPRMAGQAQMHGNTAKASLREAAGVGERGAAVAKDIQAFLESAPAPAAFECTKTTEGNETIAIGREKIELIHVGAGHTDNDLIVFLPGRNVLHGGDILFHKLHSYFDPAAGSNSAGWAKSANRIAEVCNDKTIVVPGHGEVGDRAIATAQVAYLKAARGAADKAVAAGKTRDEFIKSEVEGFAYGERIKAVAFGALYDEAKNKAPAPE